MNEIKTITVSLTDEELGFVSVGLSEHITRIKNERDMEKSLPSFIEYCDRKIKNIRVLKERFRSQRKKLHFQKKKETK